MEQNYTVIETRNSDKFNQTIKTVSARETPKEKQCVDVFEVKDTPI